LEQAKEYLNGRYYPSLLCALRTGMRVGEIQALQWDDVDFNSRFIDVKRSWRKGRLSNTKNKQRRRVDMTPHLAETLKSLRVTQKRQALKRADLFLNGFFQMRMAKCYTEKHLKKLCVSA